MTIEGLKFRVTGPQLRGHFEKLAAQLPEEADRVEQIAVDRASANTEAVQRAKKSVESAHHLATVYSSWAQLVGEEDRLLTTGDLTAIMWPTIKRTDASILETLTRKSPLDELLRIVGG